MPSLTSQGRTESYFLLSSLQAGFQPHLFSGTILFVDPLRLPSNSRSVNPAGTPTWNPWHLGFPNLRIGIALPFKPGFLLSLCLYIILLPCWGNPPRLSTWDSALLSPRWAPSEGAASGFLVDASVYNIMNSRGTCSPLGKEVSFYIFLTSQNRKGFR